MSEPNAPAETKKRTADSIEKLQRLVEGMSAEDRDKLQRAGVVIPTGSLQSVSDDTFKWGVRCTACNQIALYLIGDSWTVDGIETDMPPPVPHHAIMWTQKLPPHEINRRDPRCQCCGAPVPLNSDGSFSRERHRIVLVGDFESSRDASFDRKNVRETLKRVASGSGSIEGVGAFDRDYVAKDEPASQTLTRQRGDGVVRDIETVARLTGADQFGRSK